MEKKTDEEIIQKLKEYRLARMAYVGETKEEVKERLEDKEQIV